MTPRGVRNNNPGNIDRGQPWQGLAKPHEMTPEQRAEKRFAVFRSPEWGIRAIVRILQTYREKYGLASVEGIINRWAPPVENDTGAYMARVAKDMGVGPTATLDTTDAAILLPLVKAIIAHENGGNPYDDATILKGITLAGMEAEQIEAPPKPLQKSNTLKMSVGGLSFSAIFAFWTELKGSMPEVVDKLVPYLPWLVMLLFAGLIVNRVLESRRGER